MATPKDKASALINNFKTYSYVAENENHECQTLLWNAKMCARMCVEEIIPCTWKSETYNKWGFIATSEETTTEYWEEVKKEIANYTD